MTQKIIIICGPTAAGKTQVGIKLAQKFNGEIVSADSGQVWRGFDIGTAKHPSCVVRHALCAEKYPPQHLVDIANPDEHFDAARFVKLADDAIIDISGRGKIPFVVGGTGMYLKMLVHGLCRMPARDEKIRKGLKARAESDGIASLYDELKKVDPATASKLPPTDRTRIIRALEIFEITGAPASEFRGRHKFMERRYDALKIGLNIGREELYRRINERVDKMIEEGLVEEVRGLLSKYDENCQPFSAVGYREIVAYLRGRIGLDEAINLTKQMSRNFAKRQLTWFRADKAIRWFNPCQIEEIAEIIGKFVGM